MRLKKVDEPLSHEEISILQQSIDSGIVGRYVVTHDSDRILAILRRHYGTRVKTRIGLAMVITKGIREGSLNVNLPSDTNHLTRREKEIAELFLKGESRKNIATSNLVSVKTVEFQLYKLYKKLGAHNYLQAVAILTAISDQ